MEGFQVMIEGIQGNSAEVILRRILVSSNKYVMVIVGKGADKLNYTIL